MARAGDGDAGRRTVRSGFVTGTSWKGNRKGLGNALLTYLSGRMCNCCENDVQAGRYQYVMSMEGIQYEMVKVDHNVSNQSRGCCGDSSVRNHHFVRLEAFSHICKFRNEKDAQCVAEQDPQLD